MITNYIAFWLAGGIVSIFCISVICLFGYMFSKAVDVDGSKQEREKLNAIKKDKGFK